jgi:glycosyltransferase involved in cell wall biosynthesis
VDLERFRFRPDARAAIRSRLGLGDRPVMVYSGSLGSWYLPDAMFDLLEVAEPSLPGLHFLVLSPQAALAQAHAGRRGLGGRVTALSIPPPEVPDYLSAADFGVSFIAPSPSKAASSPTKLAEYLACGLPAVMNPGVGDVDALAGERGWILTGLDRDALGNAGHRVAAELARADVRTATREVAQRRFALEEAVRRYDRLYRRVMDGKRT